MKTKKCAACTAWENKDSDEYQEFIAQHECTINHVGSAGAMESAGLVEIFSSSQDFNNLRYVEFLGDRGTKSHLDVVAANPYTG